MMNCLKFVALAALGCAGTFAGATDIAQLQNGFAIRHESREVMGTTTRLYLDSTSKSYVDVQTADIVSISHEADTTLPAIQAPVPPVGGNVHDTVTAASATTGLDPDLIDSVIKAESNFNPNAVSRKGARGLMQLMPATAEQLGVKDSLDPKSNVDAGSRYLRDLLLQYNRDLAKALAAYNAGSGPVDRYHGVPPYRETYSYVARIIADFNRKKLAERAALTGHRRSKSAASGQNVGQAPQPLSTAEGASPSKTE